MSRVLRPEIGYLAFHPGIAVFALNMSADRGHQIAHRPYPAIRRFETEPKLVSGGHCTGVYNTRFSTWQSALSIARRTRSRPRSGERMKPGAQAPGSKRREASALKGRKNGW